MLNRKANRTQLDINSKPSQSVPFLKPLASPTASTDIGDVDLSYLKTKISRLEQDIQQKQETFITRERAYKARIGELEEEINQQRFSNSKWGNQDSGSVDNLKTIHKEILKNVELVQDRTSRILQDQEKDLLRAFRARLFDVQTELEKEKSKKDDGDARAWIKKSHDLEERVENTKELADRLERTNQSLTQENKRLQTQFKSQEEDRDFIVKQLELTRKDNTDLRNRYERLEREVYMLEERERVRTAEKGNSAPRAAAKGTGGADADDRYKDVNKRLKKLLDAERKSLQHVRANYQQELSARTETELLLRQCIEDVRREISSRRTRDGFVGSVGDDNLMDRKESSVGFSFPIEKFTPQDRERVLELLLSQERVVSLLYATSYQIPAMDIQPEGDSSSNLTANSVNS